MTIDRVSLGDLIELKRRPAQVLPDEEYPEVGVYCFGRGLFHKQPRSGLEVGEKKLFHIKARDFILQVTFAWEGAVAVAGKEDEGFLGSVRVLTFQVDENQCLPEYLLNYFRTPEGVEQLGNISPGSAGRNRVLSVKRIPEVTVPLPPLSEQRRIVAKIERLAKKIDMANSLRSQSTAEADALFQSAMHAIWSNQAGWSKAKIGDVASTVSGQVDPTCEPYASMPHINGESMESSTGRLLNNYRLAKDDGVKSGKYHFKAGAVLYSKIRPYLRKSVIVPFEGICSADVYAVDEIDSRIDPGFFKYTLISQDFTDYANNKSGRTRMPKLNQKQLFDYEMVFPSIEEQSEIVIYLDSLQAKIDRLGAVHSQTQKELDALLPSVLDKAFKGELFTEQVAY